MYPRRLRSLPVSEPTLAGLHEEMVDHRADDLEQFSDVKAKIGDVNERLDEAKADRVKLIEAVEQTRSAVVGDITSGRPGIIEQVRSVAEKVAGLEKDKLWLSRMLMASIVSTMLGLAATLTVFVLTRGAAK